MQPYQILVCEQNADHAELLSYNLKKAGYLPTVISPGEVLGYATKSPPDVIILGSSLTDHENAKLSKKIKKKGKLTKTFILCLTTNGHCELTTKKSGAYIDACLILPQKPKKIVKTVKQLLSQAQEVTASTKKKDKS